MKDEYIFKIMNKTTKEYGSGVNTYWSDSFLHTTLYDKESSAKAVLTKIKKEREWYKKQVYFKEDYLKKYDDYLEQAVIVKIKISLEIV